MSENFTWREQLKTNFKINLLFSILWANPQGVTRAQMSQISGDECSTEISKRIDKRLKCQNNGVYSSDLDSYNCMCHKG